jgi:intein/homing endonuclease
LGREITASNLCLAGDTLVDIKLNGKELRVSMIELNGIYTLGGWDTLEVKSYNTDTKETEYKTVIASAQTNPKAKVMRITDTNTGKSIRCTPDHQIFTENRGYVMAKDLKEDDILVIN